MNWFESKAKSEELKQAIAKSEQDSYLALCPLCHVIMYIHAKEPDTEKWEGISYIQDDPSKGLFKCDCGHTINAGSKDDDSIFIYLERLYYLLSNPKNKEVLDTIYLNRHQFK